MSSRTPSPSNRRRPARRVSPSLAKSPPHVLVIGGGIMGTSSALALAREGARVTVLERSIPGAEASSAAAGILGPQIESQTPGPLFDLCRASATLYPRWVQLLQAETAIDVGYRGGGALHVGFERGAVNKTFRSYAWQNEQDLPVLRFGRAELGEREPELHQKLAGGVFFSGDGRIEPPLLYRATHIAASRAGVEFRSGAYVRRVLVEGERCIGVELDDGQRLLADATVVAAGSWTSLVGGLDLRKNEVVPARGQIVEVRSPEPLLRRLVFGPGCYLLPRDDGRLLIGSTLEFVGYRKEVTAGGVRDLLDAAIALVPKLANATVERTWSNFRPYTKDHLPLLGRGGPEGLIIASGHYRTGILLAPITADTVTRLVFGKRPRLSLSPFDPRR